MRLRRTILIIIMLFTAGFSARAQLYSNDFENQYDWYPPWTNLRIVADSTALEGSYVCACDSTMEYGLGITINAGEQYPKKNINIQYEVLFRTESTDPQAVIAFSIDDSTGNKYWQSYPLVEFVNDTAAWSRLSLNLNFPTDYIGNGKISTFVWNRENENLWFDNAKLEVKPLPAPNYQNKVEIDSTALSRWFPYLNLIPVVEYINPDGDTISDPSIVETNIESHQQSIVRIESRFKEDVKLLRLAYVLPLPNGDITVYRRNQHIDSTHLQPSYYLDREGFTVINDSITISTYHNIGISSLQLDTEHRTACFNIDYWRDHPLLHYPMRSDTSDYFEDISYREVKAGEVLQGEINLHWGSTEYWRPPKELPRLMPIWDGYLSAFIFTEHADWTDIRTHRAVLFGNESITRPEDAVSGFCYYNIPVTKSVFYWNPDNVTNAKISKGRFPGLVASIKTDKDFYKLLKAIKKRGFEICLHTPEVYTTIPDEFPKAMQFMKRKFDTKSWIDHGYNNGPDKNREDMVCDGLLPDAPQYAAELWKKYGVRYLWNAYYEENRMESLHFDGHLVQPYDGFSDALPNRQITTLPNGDQDFLLWSTPSTLEVNEDREWHYFFDAKRLQRLADNHNVFITHIYPAWSDPWRAFWQYDENGIAEAMPGFNFALEQLANFRDEKKILPTTIEQYLSHYEKLLHVDYAILDDNTIALVNNGNAIEGLTLLCSRPLVVEDKPINFRKVDEGYLVWFNLKKNETVIIKIR
ncbi:MAG: hypothetical protein IKM99_06185 [Bacteroidales bacterium]|nr:hypothetical protein [Bacteroidales bacterium]